MIARNTSTSSKTIPIEYRVEGINKMGHNYDDEYVESKYIVKIPHPHKNAQLTLATYIMDEPPAHGDIGKAFGGGKYIILVYVRNKKKKCYNQR